LPPGEGGVWGSAPWIEKPMSVANSFFPFFSKINF